VSRDALPDDLLDREPGEAVRRLALAFLERARRARQALAAGDDPEALHDFRVALRRLRSLLRAFPEEARQAVTRRQLRAVRDLARATNAARDAEVALDEIARLLPAPEPRQRRGMEALRARLRASLAEVDERAAAELLPAFDRLGRRLAGRLGRYRVELRLDGTGAEAPPFRSILVERLSCHRSDLADALAAARTGGDEEAHRARIAAKRLRYLVEPACQGLASSGAVVASLKRLQDLLGELNDLRQLSALIASAAADLEAHQFELLAAGESRLRRPPERSGLRALAHRLAPRRDELSRQLRRRWLTPKAANRLELERALDALAAELASSPLAI